MIEGETVAVMSRPQVRRAIEAQTGRPCPHLAAAARSGTIHLVVVGDDHVGYVTMRALSPGGDA